MADPENRTQAASTGKKRGGRAGLFAGLTALVLNFKALAPLLLKGGTWLKMGWLFKTGFSMILFLGVYTAVYGWGFAVAMVALIMIHEMGHWVLIRANGIKSDVPIFIPFLGAVVALKELPADQATRAWIAFAGPLIGGLGALAFWYLGIATNSGWLMAGGSFGFFLNLFQLLPAKPFDGGWIVGAFSKLLLVPGTLVLICLAIWAHSPFLFLVAVIAVMSLFAGDPKDVPVPRKKTVAQLEQELVTGVSTPPPVVPGVKPLTGRQRWAVGMSYLVLAGFLGVMQVHSVSVMKEKMNISNPTKYLQGRS